MNEWTSLGQALQVPEHIFLRTYLSRSLCNNFENIFIQKICEQIVPTATAEFIFCRGGGAGGRVSDPLCISSSSAPYFFQLFFSRHPVHRDDRHLLAHAVASDFPVTWQWAQLIFLKTGPWHKLVFFFLRGSVILFPEVFFYRHIETGIRHHYQHLPTLSPVSPEVLYLSPNLKPSYLQS
jgi:hypothetical protein